MKATLKETYLINYMHIKGPGKRSRVIKNYFGEPTYISEKITLSNFIFLIQKSYRAQKRVTGDKKMLLQFSKPI